MYMYIGYQRCGWPLICVPTPKRAVQKQQRTLWNSYFERILEIHPCNRWASNVTRVLFEALDRRTSAGLSLFERPATLYDSDNNCWSTCCGYTTSKRSHESMFFLYRAVEWLTIATSEIVKPLKFFVRHTLICKENADNAADANDHTSRSKL